MPLSRFQLRNEYGLGVKELYSEASKKEDPKAVLDGVAVAGLIGLLRQLGDLAEFAAEIFHGVQEEITTTASRSQKLMSRLKHIEVALPPLEKAMLSQTSHIHFAYTPGIEWHPRIRNEQNHFIYADLPRCIADSYEECKEPPRLHLLDKFDTGDLGSCLKRYSDPTFFRRASGNSSVLNDEKSKKARKARKAKKKRSRKRSSQLSSDASNLNYRGRGQISSPPRHRQASPNQTVSTFDMTFKSDLVDRSDSLGSADGMGFIECVFHPSASGQTNEAKSKQSLSGSGDKLINNLEAKYPGKQKLVLDDDSPRSSIMEENGQRSSIDSWDDESEQEIKPTIWKSWNNEVQEMREPAFQDMHEPDITNDEACVSSGSNEMEELQEKNHEGNEKLEEHDTKIHHDDQGIDESLNPVLTFEPDEVESETDNFVDALNNIESESENDFDSRKKEELALCSNPKDDFHDEVDYERISDGIHDQSPSLSCNDLDLCESTSVQDVYSGVTVARDDKRACGLREDSSGEFMSEQPIVNSTNFDRIALWTNGGLLGLQPSKPPDFSNPGISAGRLNQNIRTEDDNLKEKLDTPASDSRSNYENAKVQQSTAVSVADADFSRMFAHSESPLLPSMMHPEASGNVDVKDTSNEEAEHVYDSRSSLFTGFGHGLLRNSFRRTRSMEYSKIPESVGYEKPCDLESNSPCVTEFAPPSPSIEHMKISFQPNNSLGTSKLKLKYPEGISRFDEISDAFPSFQLVPEPTFQHAIDLDSDDDTFCRSNPCISDDNVSHLSDSNSELWESGATSESSRDPHTSNSRLCRISSGESFSSSAEHEEMKDTSIEDDIGSSVNPFGFHETEISYSSEFAPMEPFDLRELNLEPPPLPPLQWRVLKSQSDPLEGKERTSPGFMSLFGDSNSPVSAFPHPSKPASDDLIHTVTENVNVTANNKQSAEQSLQNNAQKKLNPGNVRKVDERDDFLQQIRTRSFNLRKTGLLKPAPTPAPPPPSVEFTAILKKANAIRQAVGSDDGEEDDRWSDT